MCAASSDTPNSKPDFLGVRVSRELTSFRFGAEESVLCGDHAVRKYSWTSWIAAAPSPTADATRLTERQRASPRKKARARASTLRKAADDQGREVAAASFAPSDSAGTRPSGKSPTGLGSSPALSCLDNSTGNLFWNLDR